MLSERLGPVLRCGGRAAPGHRHPDRIVGVVMVDGGYPWDYLATVSDGDREAGCEQIRKLFRRYQLAMPMARLTGNAAKMPLARHRAIRLSERLGQLEADPSLYDPQAV